jgi:uncharacterized protein YbjT (DUF2867 family)
MYTIAGATGHIGHIIAELLLKKGEKVRVIGRSAERLQPLVDKGAEAVVADLTDTTAVTKAFTGAKAVFILIPPNPSAKNVREFQNQIGESLATAIKNSGVKYVVNLSSLGAHLSEGTGIILGLHDQELRLNKLEGVNILHLRPTFFMENIFGQIGIIKNMGVMGSPVNPDLPISQISTRDIAEYAFNRLTQLDFEGKSSRELFGPDVVSMSEMASIIGKAIGKEDLKFVQFSYEDSTKAILGMGMSEDVANNLVALNRAFNDDILKPTEKRTEENTTSTTVKEFANIFAQVYEAQQT